MYIHRLRCPRGTDQSLPSVLTREYPGSQFETYYSGALASVAFAGTVTGMLIFGWISDGIVMGMAAAPLCVILFSAMSSIVAIPGGPEISVGEFVGWLCFMRFLLGIGIGAGHTSGMATPLERTWQDGIAKNAQHRWLVLGTKTMIDAGFVLAFFVPLVLYWCFSGEQQHLRMICSHSLGFGAVPPIVLICGCIILFHQPVPEPDSNSSELVHIPGWLTVKWYWKSVLGLSLAWFIYDSISYVHFGIYSSMIMNNITGGSSSLTIVFGWSIVINLFYIPGTVLGTFIIDYLGLKTTMIVGLLLQATIGFAMGTMYSPLTNHTATFAVFYGLFLTLGEVGPGSCLRILAAKTGPTAHISGQFYNIAATIGKVGAFIGTWVFPRIIDAFGGSKTAKGNTGPFWIGSGLAILGAVVTFFLVKTHMHDEEKAFRQYLEEKGFDMNHMDVRIPVGEGDV
ncbi:major facilitator superfamily domain-containing protein [Pisolithus orientalis]|uniref:major facilitator superfamily domain-containing protein n=1 Tax=Pisolithus orientalis TaxID=936130 RepID=UPI002224A340|nr:major facilitator superfamily domain-containing protein [Pisolithus orientalis]KAI5989203.1 major facilitator superfamily domain-containing protein [Pisolithus orientalis]